ncbi:MAG: hypothetical protein ACE5GT_06825 [Rhodospirillales bacterium]
MHNTMRKSERGAREALRRWLERTDARRASRTAGRALWLGRPTLSLRPADILCRCVSGQVVDTLLTAARGLFYLGIAVIITVAQFYLLILMVLT